MLTLSSVHLLAHVMIGIKHEVLNKFLKPNPHLFHGFEGEDVFEFIFDCYKKLHKLRIAHQLKVEFLTFHL